MCRANKRCNKTGVIVACAALLGGSLVLASRADAQVDTEEAVSDFLEQAGVDSVLAAQLEELLDTTSDVDQRIEIAERLAEVYARLIERTDAPEAQDALERKSLALIDRVPNIDTGAIRLRLAQAGFLRARERAELARFGLIVPEEHTQIGIRLAALGSRFAEIAQDANARARRLRESQRVKDDDLVRSAMQQARQLGSQANFLAGMSYFYAADLARDDNATTRANVHFGRLLNPPDGPPEIGALDDRLLSTGYLAEAAIAVAELASIAGTPVEAVRWLDRIDSASSVPVNLRERASHARLRVLARASRWFAALTLGDDLRERGDTPSLPGPDHQQDASGTGTSSDDDESPRFDLRTARLVALLTLRGERLDRAHNADRETLRDLALTDLIAMGELAHVMDLTRDLGTDTLGTDTFVSQYVRGLNAYNEAREAFEALAGARAPGTLMPVNDGEVGRRYRLAAELFEGALALDDAERFPEAEANTLLLLAECLFLAADTPGAVGDRENESAQQRLVSAAERFAQASAVQRDDALAQSALWRAIRAYRLLIDRVSDALSPGEVETERAEALDGYRARLADLGEQFIERFPRSDGARRLLVDRAIAGEIEAEESIALLLDIPPSSPDYERAQRAAARAALRTLRQAPSAERDWHASRFIRIAEPLLLVDIQRASSAQGGEAQEAADRALDQARLILDAALALRTPDGERARRMLSAIDRLAAQGLVTIGPYADEIDYQRARLALVEGDTPRASALVDALAQRGGRYADAARRLFFTHARDQFERLQEDNADDTTLEPVAERLVRHARQLLEELEGEPGWAGAALSTADAALVLWRTQADTASRGYAHILYNDVLESRPNDARALEGGAFAAEAVGEDDLALQRWRTLVSGLETGTDDWFRARYHQLRVLADVDPARATEALRAHAVYYAPSFGPEPWGARIKALHDAHVGEDAP